MLWTLSFLLFSSLSELNQSQALIASLQKNLEGSITNQHQQQKQQPDQQQQDLEVSSGGEGGDRSSISSAAPSPLGGGKSELDKRILAELQSTKKQLRKYEAKLAQRFTRKTETEDDAEATAAITTNRPLISTHQQSGENIPTTILTSSSSTSSSSSSSSSDGDEKGSASVIRPLESPRVLMTEGSSQVLDAILRQKQEK